MAFLRKVEANGFRSFQELSVELQGLNWLIGANGAGKSNFLSLFKFLEASASGRLQNYVSVAGGGERILHYGAKQTPTMDVRLMLAESDQDLGYALRLVPSADDRLVIERESLRADGSDVVLGAGTESTLSSHDPLRAHLADIDEQSFRILDTEPGRAYKGVDQIRASLPPLIHAAFSSDSALQRGFMFEALQGGRPSMYVAPVLRAANLFCSNLRQWRVYHFNDTSPNAPIRKKALFDENRFLHPDGSNLAAILYLLRQKHPADYEQIRETIQRIAPYFADFELEPDPLNEARILLRWRERSSAHGFSISELSDGTLRFICLTTLLLQPNPPPLILLDEPELGLHPAALGLLSAMLHMAAHRTQLIVATQCVELLEAEPDAASVLVLDRGRQGGATIHRLDPAALQHWLADYSLGELWKKNVPGFGGRP